MSLDNFNGTTLEKMPDDVCTIIVACVLYLELAWHLINDWRLQHRKNKTTVQMTVWYVTLQLVTKYGAQMLSSHHEFKNKLVNKEDDNMSISFQHSLEEWRDHYLSYINHDITFTNGK